MVQNASNDFAKTDHHNFLDDSVHNGTTWDRPKLLNLGCIWHFWYKSNKGIVYILIQFLFFKKFPNCLDCIFSNNIPSYFVKLWTLSIDSRCSGVIDASKGFVDLFIINWGKKGLTMLNCHLFTIFHCFHIYANKVSSRQTTRSP